jgi:SAM-dependent methyltransferase
VKPASSADVSLPDMTPKLYRELVPWYGLLTRSEEYVDEAACFRDAILARAPHASTLLELGAGAGHNAKHLKARFRCTLTDLSAEMLALSRAQNPDCEHVVADMRTLRLGHAFDAVLVHDAIVYMTTEADLRAALETAFVHLRPGGVAVVAPDAFKDTFEDGVEVYEGQEGDRALKCMEWSWDPDPEDDTCVTDFAFLLREGGSMTAVHDRHVEGLFTTATWVRLLEEIGFRVERAARPVGDGETDEIFVAVRP